jgi:hypothetical protein
MVTIVDFKERTSKDDEQFYVLILQGGVEMVRSKETNRFYATAKRASISSTFDKRTCESLIGSTFPGSIQREECSEYEYVIPETGEVLNLSHRWVYVDNVEETADKVLVNAASVI